MALRYLIYRTDYGNTIVRENPTSGTTTGGIESEVYTDFSIPITQPLYFWYVNEGIGIFENSETNINLWLENITPPPSPNSLVTTREMQEYSTSIVTFSGYTGTTGLQQITDVNAITSVESTFNGGLITNKIRPTGDTITAIQIHK